MAITKKNFIELLKAATEYGASDIHIREDEVPCFRIHGDLIPIKSPPVTNIDITSICKILIENEDILQVIGHLKEYDGGKTFHGVCRVRYNFLRFQGKTGLVIRLIKTDIMQIDQLGLPNALKDIALQQRGLVLLTGPTGSGKSTTMAAMIDYINAKKNAHIVTIEDPIEFIYKQKKSRITQREVGIDTESFTKGLRSALRQDPDVIAIGEMRDVETVDICLKAAETGHLVISTIHTSSAENTIGRVLGMFSAEVQREAKLRLADNLLATVSQRLIKKSDSKGMTVAQEIMVTSPGIKACISGKEDMKNLYTYIREGNGPGGNGSQMYDQHILQLLKKGYITKEAAIAASSASGDFAKSLDFEP